MVTAWLAQELVSFATQKLDDEVIALMTRHMQLFGKFMNKNFWLVYDDVDPYIYINYLCLNSKSKGGGIYKKYVPGR